MAPSSPERFISSFSTHWVKYVGPIALYLLLACTSLLLFLLAGVSAHHIMWLSHAALFAALVLLLFAHHWFFTRLLSESIEDVFMTTERVIYLKVSLFFSDDMHEIHWSSVQAVEARQEGLIQNMLGYGCVWFDTGGSSSVDLGDLIHRVPHPQRVTREIIQILEEHRRRGAPQGETT